MDRPGPRAGTARGVVKNIRQDQEGKMKEAWEKFENSPAAGLVVVVVWCGMLISIMWVATV